MEYNKRLGVLRLLDHILMLVHVFDYGLSPSGEDHMWQIEYGNYVHGFYIIL